MKMNPRKALWALALVVGLSVFAPPQLLVAQSQQGLEHGKGHDKDKDKDKDQDEKYAGNPYYQRGKSHGEEDRDKHDRHYRSYPDKDEDRRAYEAGYEHGYSGSVTPGTRGQQDPQRIAYNNGFRTGLTYGQNDRNTGHSNRPTYSSTYKNGTSGYNSSMGSQTAYKHAFQQGFMHGYEQGYNQGYRK